MPTKLARLKRLHKKIHTRKLLTITLSATDLYGEEEDFDLAFYLAEEEKLRKEIAEMEKKLAAAKKTTKKATTKKTSTEKRAKEKAEAEKKAKAEAEKKAKEREEAEAERKHKEQEALRRLAALMEAERRAKEKEDADRIALEHLIIEKKRQVRLLSSQKEAKIKEAESKATENKKALVLLVDKRKKKELFEEGRIPTKNTKAKAINLPLKQQVVQELPANAKKGVKKLSVSANKTAQEAANLKAAEMTKLVAKVCLVQSSNLSAIIATNDKKRVVVEFVGKKQVIEHLRNTTEMIECHKKIAREKMQVQVVQGIAQKRKEEEEMKRNWNLILNKKQP
jgi:hypothetical protein